MNKHDLASLGVAVALTRQLPVPGVACPHGGGAARLQQRLHPELCAIHPDQPFDFSELAYLLPRDPALKAWVDTWLHISAETGEQARLLAKWLN